VGIASRGALVEEEDDLLWVVPKIEEMGGELERLAVAQSVRIRTPCQKHTGV
jgi:hypothetical protein